MSTLICRKCKQIPYIEFIPGLSVKFMCCTISLISHKDLNNFIEKDFTLRCQEHKNNVNINYVSKKLLCDSCINKFNIKSFIKCDSIPIHCLIDNKHYEYYDLETHVLYCEFCKRPCTAKKIEDIKKKLLIGKIETKKEFIDISPYYKCLAERINKTYETYKNNKISVINPYLNLLNLNNFINDYSIISPICQICKEIYNINICDNIDEINNNNILEISCKCGNNFFSSVNEFENKINSIICDGCKTNFNQMNIFFDILSDNILCDNCLNKRNTFDYIRFNEIAYICKIHRNKYEKYCDLCGKMFCKKCTNINNHNNIIIKENKGINTKYLLLNDSNWFNKFKTEGFLNLKNNRKDCCVKMENVNKMMNDFMISLEKKENRKLKDLLSDLKNDSLINLGNIRLLKLKSSNYSSLLKLEEQNKNLEQEMNKLKFSLDIIYKEFSDKHEIFKLIKIRNVLQHVFANIIKKNYNCIENIEDNFKILYD